ncbi:hypothetical protein ACVBEQ_26445 [Nakamurella sp. GG22]
MAPLCDFPFRFVHPATALAGHREIESLLVRATGDPNHPRMLAAIADRAHDLLGATLTTGGATRPLNGYDVAVVVLHNAQASVVHAFLRGRDVCGITVDAADSLQVGQWAAVVALDSLADSDGLPAHAAAPVRLCVMASRELCPAHRGARQDWRASPSADRDTLGRVVPSRDALLS